MVPPTNNQSNPFGVESNADKDDGDFVNATVIGMSSIEVTEEDEDCTEAPSKKKVPTMEEFWDNNILDQPDMTLNEYSFGQARRDTSAKVWDMKCAQIACAYEFAADGLRGAGTTEMDDNHHLAQLWRNTNQRIADASREMEEQQAKSSKKVTLAESNFVRRVKNSVRMAVDAKDNGGFNDNASKKHWHQEIPAHADVLACRYMHPNGGINSIIAGHLGECKYGHLLSVVPASTSAPASGGGIGIDISDTVAAGLVAKQKKTEDALKQKDEVIGELVGEIDLLKEKIKATDENVGGLEKQVDAFEEKVKRLQAAAEKPDSKVINNLVVKSLNGNKDLILKMVQDTVNANETPAASAPKLAATIDKRKRSSSLADKPEEQGKGKKSRATAAPSKPEAGSAKKQGSLLEMYRK